MCITSVDSVKQQTSPTSAHDSAAHACKQTLFFLTHDTIEPKVIKCRLYQLYQLYLSIHSLRHLWRSHSYDGCEASCCRLTPLEMSAQEHLLLFDGLYRCLELIVGLEKSVQWREILKHTNMAINQLSVLGPCMPLRHSAVCKRWAAWLIVSLRPTLLLITH